MFEMFSALIGAVVGALMTFWLTILVQTKDQASRERNIRLALLAELKENLHLISKRIELGTKLRNKLQLKNHQSIIIIPFPKAIYASFLPSIYSDLTPEQARSLHLIYTYLTIVDEVYQSIDALNEESKKFWHELQPYQGTINKLDDAKTLMEHARELITHYLKGSISTLQLDATYFGPV